eukprot:gene5222-8834_t
MKELPNYLLSLISSFHIESAIQQLHSQQKKKGQKIVKLHHGSGTDSYLSDMIISSIKQKFQYSTISNEQLNRILEIFSNSKDEKEIEYMISLFKNLVEDNITNYDDVCFQLVNISKFVLLESPLLNYLNELIEITTVQTKSKIFEDLIVFSTNDQIQNQKIYKNISDTLFRLIFTTNEPLNFVSGYLLMKDLFEMKNPNIYLTQLISYFKSRKESISRLMSTNSDVGNIYSFSNFIAKQKEIVLKNGIEIIKSEIPKKNTSEWNTRVQLLVLLFSQRAPSTLFQFLFSNFEKKIHEYFTIEMLNEAISKRISDLIEESNLSDEETLKEKWLIFSDTVYSVLERHYKTSGLNIKEVMFDGDFMTVEKYIALHRNGIKTSHLLAFLLQISPTYAWKEMIVQYCEFEDPRFLKLIYDISLSNKEDSSVQLALHFLEKRLVIYGFNVKNFGIDFKNEIGMQYEKSYPGFMKSFSPFNLTDEDLKKISIISTFLTDISKSIAGNLISQKESSKNLDNQEIINLPNSKLNFHSMMKPLSLDLIKALSVHARHKRLFDLIEKILYSSDEKFKSISTGVHLFETYVKILYVSPLFFFQTLNENPITILNYLENADSFESNSIIFCDLINHRLIHFFKFNECDIFITTIFALIQKNTKKKLQILLENIGIKILDHIISVESFEKLIQNFQTSFHCFTVNLRIHFVYTLCRLYKIRKYPQQNLWNDNLNQLLNIFSTFKDCLKISIPKSTLEFFHDDLNLDFFKEFKVDPSSRELNLKTVQAEFQQNKFEFDRPDTLQVQISNFCKQSQKNILVFIFYFYFELKQANQSTDFFDLFYSKCRIILLQFQFNSFSLLFSNLLSFVELNYKNSLEIASKYLSELIWKYDIIPFEVLISNLILLDNEIHIDLLEYFLLKDEEFKSRYQCFMDLNFKQDWWNLDSDDIRNRCVYHKKFPDSWGIEPSYFSSVILRSIPYFNMMIRRLIELKKDDFLSKFLAEYSGLFKYHEYYLTFVSDLFLFYNDGINQKIKKKLLKIGTSNDLVLSSRMKEFINQHKINTLNVEENYFFDEVSKLSKFIPTSKNFKNSVKFEMIFKEFNSEFDLNFHSLMIELISIPSLTIKELTKKLLQTLRKNVTFDYVHTLVLLLSSFPEESYDEILNFSSEFLENEKIFSFLKYSLEDQENEFIRTEINLMISFFHCLFNYGNSTLIWKFINHLENINIKTIEQQYFLCRIFAPFSYKYSSIKQKNHKFIDLVTFFFYNFNNNSTDDHKFSQKF